MGITIQPSIIRIDKAAVQYGPSRNGESHMIIAGY